MLNVAGDYIKDRIDTIFEIEESNLIRNKHFHYIEKSDDSERNPSEHYFTAFTVAPLIDLDIRPNDNFCLEWDTYKTLKQLYNKIQNNPENRNLFIDHIKNKLINGHSYMKASDGIYYDTSSLALYFLMKIGKNDENVEILKIINKNNKKKRTTREGLINDLLIFMHLEPFYFDFKILNSLKELNFQYLCHRDSPAYFKLNDEINLMKYSKLKDELKDVNEEINIHKEKIIGLISKYNFPKKMEIFLLEIDKIFELPDSEPIYSGMIGNLRSFFEELTRNIAETIESKTGEKCSNRKIGTLRAYINKYLNLSEHEDKFIDSFIVMLHVEGGHELVSEKKYFVLSKNIGIEIAYFLLSKLEDFMKK